MVAFLPPYLRHAMAQGPSLNSDVEHLRAQVLAAEFVVLAQHLGCRLLTVRRQSG